MRRVAARGRKQTADDTTHALRGQGCGSRNHTLTVKDGQKAGHRRGDR